MKVARILEFNRQMAALASDAELVAGVGRSNVFGGKYDSASGEGKTRELRDLVKVFVEERLRVEGAVTEVAPTPSPSCRPPHPCTCPSPDILYSEFVLPVLALWSAGEVALETWIDGCLFVVQQLEADLHELQSTLGLGPKEVASIRNDVTSTVYKCAVVVITHATSGPMLQ